MKTKYDLYDILYVTIFEGVGAMQFRKLDATFGKLERRSLAF